MLTHVHIRNFRSCVDVTLDNLDYIAVLLGRNGAGKTNILRAIHWMARIATTSQSPFGLGRLGAFSPEVAPASVEIEALIDKCKYRYEISFDITSQGQSGSSGQIRLRLTEFLKVTEDGQEWVDLLNRDNDQVTLHKRPSQPITISSVLTGCLPALLAILPADDPIIKQIKPFSSFLGKIRYYPVDEQSDPYNPFDSQSIINDSTYKQYLAALKSDQPQPFWGQSVCLRLIHMHLAAKDRLQDLIDLIGENGLKLIDEINVQMASSTGPVQQERDTVYFVGFKLGEFLGGGERIYRYPDLSLGTRRILHILVSLVFDDSSVMLIEHPEDGIHAGLLARFSSLMETNSDPTQIILSSHSITLLNKLKPENIKLVTLARHNETSVRSLTPKEIESARKHISEDGTLYEYLESIQPE